MSMTLRKKHHLIATFFAWQTRKREWEVESKVIAKRTPEEASRQRTGWQKMYDRQVAA